MLTIGVIGAGQCDAVTASAAEAVGRELAQLGAAIVCGGMGGVMEAACRGAKSAGGTTIGILPGSSAAEANPWVDLAIPTGLGEARNLIVVRAARAVVAVGGEYGTLVEIAFALKCGTPVIGLKTWQLAKASRIEKHFEEAPSAVAAARQAMAAARARA